jgi:hypothetical protein
MTFKTIDFNEGIDLSSTELQKKGVGTKLFNLVKPAIDIILQAVKNNTFDYSSFTFLRKLKSGLTDHCGFYLIINKETKKVYLGSTSDLSQRKGEHHKNLTSTSEDLSVNMREDVINCGPDSFFFVPLVRIPFTSFEGLSVETNLQTTLSQRQQTAQFLENFVETSLLEFYLNSENKDVFYNVKVTGAFQKGNTFGGSSGSGLPSKHVCFEVYAWESKSGLANSFDVDNKSVNYKTKTGLIKELSDEEFNNFSGIKIFNGEAKTYFNNKPEIYKRLRLKLFPRASKRDV